MSKDFYQRFDLKVDFAEAQKRFVNRVHNLLFEDFKWKRIGQHNLDTVDRQIVSALGFRYSRSLPLDKYIEGDFLKCLLGLEALYKAVIPYGLDGDLAKIIDRLLLESEVDLGVRWQRGKFIRSGAQLLDQELVNNTLHWLSQKKYENVLIPFSKGLDYFLHSYQKPDLLSDVITDMYEALEALAKIVTGREKDLSANRELFLKQVKASDSYKIILKDYIDYANNFRHAIQDGEKKPVLTQVEVESFVYLTGLFIRLAIKGQESLNSI